MEIKRYKKQTSNKLLSDFISIKPVPPTRPPETKKAVVMGSGWL